MKQKIGWIIGIVSVFLILIGAYFGMAAYYSQRFCYGTWINGVYCTGKSVSEVNEELILLLTGKDRNHSCGRGSGEWEWENVPSPPYLRVAFLIIA